MIDYKQIVALGKAATARPWSHFHGKLRPQFDTRINEIQSPSGAVVVWPGFDCCNLPPAQRKKDAAYIAAAANSADLMAQQLIDIGKLCEEACELKKGDDVGKWGKPAMIRVAEVNRILERTEQ